MNTRKHILLAVAFVLLASFGTAMAQRKTGTALQVPPEPIGSVVKVNAIEVTGYVTRSSIGAIPCVY